MAVPKYPAPVKIHNSGGWVLNGTRFDTRKGASMILIDDALHVAQVQLFSTPQNGTIPPPEVTVLDHESPAPAAFKAEVEEWLKASQTEWAALTEAATQSYARMQHQLLELTKADIADGTLPEGGAA